MVNTIKFSDMTPGGDLGIDDTTPGLLSGTNVLFNNPLPPLATGTTEERPTPSTLIYLRLRYNTDLQYFEYYDPIAMDWVQLAESGDVNTSEGTENQVLVNGTFGTPLSGALVFTLPQDVAPISSPSFNNLILTGANILDANNNHILGFIPTINAVNYLSFGNNITTAEPNLVATGSDADINIGFTSKGRGSFVYKTSAITNQMVINTGGSHATNFAFPNTSANRTVIFQDASGTLAYLSDITSAFTWNNVTSVSASMASSNGYKANNSSRVTLTLPVSSVFGDKIIIMGFGVGGWHISQGAGQSIIIGSSFSTVGTGGYVESTHQFDSVVLICMTDNLTWQCQGSPQGNLTIV